MSGEPIGPGDLVECIEVHGGSCLRLGAIYCVADVVPEVACACMRLGIRPWAFAHAGFRFRDVPDPLAGTPSAWCCFMFRPISRRSDFARTLEALKQPRDDVSAPQELVPETA